MPFQNDHLLKNSTGCTKMQSIEKKFKAIIILTTTQAFKRLICPSHGRQTKLLKMRYYRIRTDFLDPKFKTFFRLFCQNNNFFFHTQGYQIGDQLRDLKRRKEQSFFRGALQTYGRD